jgi:NADH-quinone oxidoreductase subunit C
MDDFGQVSRSEPKASEDQKVPALSRLLAAKPDAVVTTHARLGDATAVVRASQLVDAMRFLRDDPALAFEMLTDVCAVDYLPRVPRFEVVYHLYSVAKNHRLRVKVLVDGDAPGVPSVTPLWESANWMEREVFDLYGIRFDGHPDLRRILLYDEFEGHPLRKDYPKERRQPLVGPRN